MISKIFRAVIFSLFVVQPAVGEKLGPVMRLGPGFSPEVAYDSKTRNFFVIWSGSVPYNGRLRGTLIALDGTRTPVRTYSIPLRQSSPSYPNILFDPGSNRFLLIWQENNKNVFTRFIDTAGKASPIDRSSAAKSIKYDPNHSGIGNFNPDTQEIKLGTAAFWSNGKISPDKLAAVLYHETIHARNFKDPKEEVGQSKQGIWAEETEVLDKSIRGAKSIGLEKSVIEEMELYRRDHYYGLNPENREKVDKGNYDDVK